MRTNPQYSHPSAAAELAHTPVRAQPREILTAILTAEREPTLPGFAHIAEVTDAVTAEVLDFDLAAVLIELGIAS